jgi:hypothetical protein
LALIAFIEAVIHNTVSDTVKSPPIELVRAEWDAIDLSRGKQ